jgi:hypothetical protein
MSHNERSPETAVPFPLHLSSAINFEYLVKYSISVNTTMLCPDFYDERRAAWPHLCGRNQDSGMDKFLPKISQTDQPILV